MSVIRWVLFVCGISIAIFSNVQSKSEEGSQEGAMGFISGLTEQFKIGFGEGKEQVVLGAKFENASVAMAPYKMAMSRFVHNEERLPERLDELEVGRPSWSVKAISSISLGADGAIVGVLPEEFGSGKFLSLKPTLDDDMQIVAWSLSSNVDPSIAKGATYVE